MSDDVSNQGPAFPGDSAGGETARLRARVSALEKALDDVALRGLEEALQAARRDVSSILHSSPVGISISSVRDGRIFDMNEEFLRILGFAREEVIGRTSHEIGLWTAPGQREAIVRAFQEHGRFPPEPVTMRRKDGSLVTVLFSASALATGDEPQTIAWCMDISARLRVEEELRVSEERWRSLAENAPAVIVTLDRDATVLSVNRSITGRPASAYLGRKIYEFLHPEHREQGRALVETVLAGGAPRTGEYPVLRPDGGLHWFQVSIAPLSPATPAGGAILAATDIDARRRAEQALRESEQRFRDIVRSLGDWVWETDSSMRITYSSAQIESLLGYTAAQMLGKSPRDTCVPEEGASLGRGLEELDGQPQPFRDREVWHLHRDGRRVCLSVSGVPIYDAGGVLSGYRGVAHDVTESKREEQERRRLEAEVQQARRVESLGVLAGGIAHDFNNLLTAVLGNAELALAALPEGDTRQLIAQIQAAGRHAAELTRQMLAYAGRGRLSAERVDLTAAIREMAQLLGASIPKKVQLVLDLTNGLPAVEADPTQLRQVVMNLVINAADAIGDREGRIAVRTGAAASTNHGRADLTIGRIEAGRELACVEIVDSGDGIAPDALGRIFDPFFTTKFAGRGLGLAAVQGIVLRHGGTIAVTTAPGAGSTFRVCFPALAPLPARAPAAPGSAAAARGPWRSSGTILLVDDEEPVRTMATRMLQALGFQVLAAADGREAVAAVAADAGPRAVLLDLTMPHMDGREAFRELRRLRPNLPVILCSGYDVLENVDRFVDLDFSGFLQKPYRLDDLVRALRDALGE